MNDYRVESFFPTSDVPRVVIWGSFSNKIQSNFDGLEKCLKILITK